MKALFDIVGSFIERYNANQVQSNIENDTKMNTAQYETIDINFMYYLHTIIHCWYKPIPGDLINLIKMFVNTRDESQNVQHPFELTKNKFGFEYIYSKLLMDVNLFCEVQSLRLEDCNEKRIYNYMHVHFDIHFNIGIINVYKCILKGEATFPFETDAYNINDNPRYYYDWIHCKSHRKKLTLEFIVTNYCNVQQRYKCIFDLHYNDKDEYIDFGINALPDVLCEWIMYDTYLMYLMDVYVIEKISEQLKCSQLFEQNGKLKICHSDIAFESNFNGLKYKLFNWMLHCMNEE
eukprot:514224_1